MRATRRIFGPPRDPARPSSAGTHFGKRWSKFDVGHEGDFRNNQSDYRGDDQSESFSATLDGKPVGRVDAFCTDPLPPRFEINFGVPGDVAPGTHRLDMKTGRRLLGSVEIEIEG